MLTKLTNQDLTTHGGYLWTPGKWHKTESKEGASLCSPYYFHAYESPELAVLLNPIGADFKNPRGFRVSVRGVVKDEDGRKFGASEMRLDREIVLPEYSTAQRVAFGILCSLSIYDDEPTYADWAEKWLDGVDRSGKAAAARAAARAAEARAAAPQGFLQLCAEAAKDYR